MTRKTLTQADKAAWEAAVRHVRPLTGEYARPERVKRAERDAAPSPAEPVKRKQHVPPQNRSGERAVRRGKQPISASFDLHGHTQNSAWRILPPFLAREQAKGSKCVIVITGKGASGGGVLRRNFLTWLEMPEARALVSGYAPAHPRHGGAGAWYVFLRKREQPG